MKSSIAIGLRPAGLVTIRAEALDRGPANRRFKAKSEKNQTFDAQAFFDSANITKKVVEYGSNETVFTQGDPANSVLYILEGNVKLTVVNEAGKEAIVAIIGEGDFFGAECLAGQPKRIRTAATITPSTIVVMEKPEMIQALREKHEFSGRFIDYILARNSRVEEDLIDQLFNSPEKRLARTLLLTRDGLQGQRQTVLPKISQETLAGMIGSTRQRVNYLMNKFRKLGFIEYDGGIHVNNSLLQVLLPDRRFDDERGGNTQKKGT
jgi:CRP-like cAMP-binding protein